MKRVTLFFILAVFTLSSCNPSSAVETLVREFNIEEKKTPEEEFFPKDYQIVGFGDSLTEGLGDSKSKRGYVGRFEEKLVKEPEIKDVKIDNFAIRGHLSHQTLNIVNQKESRVAISRADLILLTTGGNDIMSVVRGNMFNLTLEPFVEANEVYKKNINAILKVIREENPTAPIMVIGLYNPFLQWFSNIQEVEQIMDLWNHTTSKMVSEYSGVHFVPIADLFQSGDMSLLYDDYFHPNNIGYQAIADRVYEEWSAHLD
ncbi:SGNH/GDSL hydrolase family protein [Mangrovibacillus cuniculi]|uniref:SGNH/GDSL hydrolase family protein n=1 Tax=Mangrovibacillus cuniculi TaxID=2593652 RepID=A0A7S8CEE7_9BACI|nr:SGNH/GDSL hydrolase family protein [Mangrovibacillus cuniculi]QPC48386.1 SGNH/GDSL hydrolase family protein [Mangrovibacillus cuniculi]